MITTNEGKIVSDIWYLDIGCSNHMTGNKDWLVDFDSSKRTSVKCASSKSMVAEDMGNIMLQRENGKVVIIENVFYVPRTSYNLISIRQLIEIGFFVTMKDEKLKLFDRKERLILTSPLSKNMTFRTSISIAEADCLNAVIPAKKVYFGIEGMAI